MKQFFIIFIIFINWISADQHYTLQKSIFIAIVDAAQGDRFHNEKDYIGAIKKYNLALKNIQNYENVGTRYNTRSIKGKDYSHGKVAANRKMISYMEYSLYFNIGRAYIGRCQQSNTMALCNTSIKYFDKAINVLNQNQKAKYYKVYYYKGYSYMVMGMLDQASENFRKAKQHSKSFVEVYNGLGVMYSQYSTRNDITNIRRKNLLNAAKKEFLKALEYDHENDIALNNLGEAEYRLGQYGRAIKNYDRAIFLNPIDPILYTNRGFAYQGQKKYTEACHNYNIAIKLQSLNTNNNNTNAEESFNVLVRSGYCTPLETTEELLPMEIPTEMTIDLMGENDDEDFLKFKDESFNEQ